MIEDRVIKQGNSNLYRVVNFDRNYDGIPTSEYNNIINAYSVFESEMETCDRYRLNITLSPIMSNVLTNRLTEVISKENGLILTGQTRINAIQTINDQLYSYKIGFDIFDNHFNRVDTFKTGNTLNDFTGSTITNVLTLPESIKKNTVEENGWFCIKNKCKIDGNKMFSLKQPLENIDLFPTRDFYLFNNVLTNGSVNYNWDFILTYPYKNHVGSILTNDQDSINGIPIIDSEVVTINSNKFLKLKTLYNNNLQVNDVIKLKRLDKNSDKTYLVYNTENDNYIYIDLDKYSDLYNVLDYKKLRVCKQIDGVDCEYYIRMFRKIPNYLEEGVRIDESNIDTMIDTISTMFNNEQYKLSFSNTIYGDPNYQIQYMDDINVGLLKDNLSRPISEIYLTIIKRKEYNDNSSQLFTDITSGIETTYTLSGYSNIRLLNNDLPIEYHITTTGGTFHDSNQENKDSFFGDIVEYNIKTAKEVILTDAKHRFNTIERETEVDFYYHDIYSNNTNILYNTSFKGLSTTGGTDYWYTAPNASLFSVNKSNLSGDTRALLIGSRLNLSDYPYAYTNTIDTLRVGEPYTLSFHALSYELNTMSVEIDGILNQQINIGNTWDYNHISFIGDGKPHKITFTANGGGFVYIYLSNIKLENSQTPSIWTPNPIDPDGQYSFDIRTKKLPICKEGYFYKPHYKINIKNFSQEVKTGVLELINTCGGFESGITFDNQIVILSGYTDSDIKNLLIKIDDTDGLVGFSYVRITKNDKSFSNFKINILNNIPGVISIPYTKFMGSLSLLNSTNFVFRKFTDDSIPLYCQDNYNNTCTWRDFLKNGIIDDESELKEELVYTNGSLYLNKNIIFYLKRQDPFGNYGLRSDTFPSNSFGVRDKTNISNVIINKINDIC